jgi:hypothetical protein
MAGGADGAGRAMITRAEAMRQTMENRTRLMSNSTQDFVKRHYDGAFALVRKRIEDAIARGAGFASIDLDVEFSLFAGAGCAQPPVFPFLHALAEEIDDRLSSAPFAFDVSVIGGHMLRVVWEMRPLPASPSPSPRSESE